MCIGCPCILHTKFLWNGLGFYLFQSKVDKYTTEFQIILLHQKIMNFAHPMGEAKRHAPTNGYTL